jgi:hypothetical protein
MSSLVWRAKRKRRRYSTYLVKAYKRASDFMKMKRNGAGDAEKRAFCALAQPPKIETTQLQPTWK